MPFDASKDKVLKSWRCEDTGLMVSINRYDQGEAKVQIGPRTFIKKDGGESQRKSGRLSMEDILWLYDTMDEIKEALSGLTKPE
jgi:hypothetical protein